MNLFLIAWIGGVLSVVSPAILPVLPFALARAGRPFIRSGLPFLAGMVVAFGIVGALAVVDSASALSVSQYGRVVALVVLAVFGLALLVPALAGWFTRARSESGARHPASASAVKSRNAGPGAGVSLLLGIATGLLWVPVAGPVLNLIVTGAALQGAGAHTSLLLLTYAAGAVISLGLAVLVGDRVFAAMRRSHRFGDWGQRGLGVAVLAGVGAIALQVDTGTLTRLSIAGTDRIEQGLLNRAAPAMATTSANRAATLAKQEVSPLVLKVSAGGALPVEGTLPALDGAVQWLNSPQLAAADLRGKVVLVNFWTYSCINSLRMLPYLKAWGDKYRAAGLVVIGVHTPEFGFEKNTANVRRAVGDLKIDYPVAVDTNHAIWNAFSNDSWPANYIIDAQGHIRYHQFGEGEYAQSEKVIRELLIEAGAKNVPGGLVTDTGAGAEAAPAFDELQSPETYVGYARAQGFASVGDPVANQPHVYAAGPLELNQWALAGTWTLGAEHTDLDRADGGIVFRFHARDLHLVLGPSADGRPVRFRVTLDGKPPGAHHGTDVDADGNGVVNGQRLYQLIRQSGPIVDRTFEIRFLDPGVQAYSFTFG